MVEQAHQRALEWFKERSGQIVGWPEPLENIYLVNRAKGIHKPADSNYALSVRQSLTGPYEDKLNFRPDGRWEITYAQEGDNPDFFTNRSLRACMVDEVPVGVMQQITPKPRPTYKILGLGDVVGFENGCFTIREHRQGLPVERVEGQPLDSQFSLSPELDARERIKKSIAVRQGQPEFRNTLLKAYDQTCAMTGCKVIAVLEAAHIMPYKGSHTNHVQNGMLLRSDVHSLFDLGIIKVDPDTYRIMVGADALPGYAELDGKLLRLPKAEADWPHRDALRSKPCTM